MLVLLNIIKSTNVGTQCPLCDFVDDAHLKGVVDMLEGRTVIQKDHGKVENRIDKYLINCNKANTKSLLMMK